MSIQSIGDFRIEVERLLAVLSRNIDDDYYPRNVYGQILSFAKSIPVTFDVPKGDATPFIEMRNGQFHFVISERGCEFERVSGNPDEILALLFEGITFDLAGQFELRHRINGQDSRKLLFSKQVDLLTLLNAEWAQSVSEKQRKTLQEFPFSDDF
jgi:hypothetical protein